MSIDLEAIRARAEAAAPAPWKIGRPSPSGAQNVGTNRGLLTAQTTNKSNANFIAHAREDIPALIAEVERLRAENETLRSELYPAKEIEEQRAKRWDAEKRLLQKTRADLDRVTAERDAAVEDLTLSNTRKFNNPCEFCKKSGKNCAPVDIQDVCKAWEWRGERSE